MKRNTLYYGDCLEVMREWPDACVDLVYLDPPFNSDADYNMLFSRQRRQNGSLNGPPNGPVTKRKDLAQVLAFTDIWEWDEASAARVAEIKKSVAYGARDAIIALEMFFHGGNSMLAYLVYMADRINEIHRIMKDSGSLYLHCDPASSHYLKMILDCAFGSKNFRNEIIWHYRTGGASKFQFARKHDIIFFYTKQPGKEHTFNLQKEKAYTKSESRRAGVVNYGGGNAEFFEDECGVFNWVNMRDIWDISYIGSTHRERLGYRTQKPLALLERIIAASSAEGDVVLDPFCGCGTTVEAAMNAKRDFIGIDISMYALDVIQHERLKDTKFSIEGTPFDFPEARHMAQNRPFAFEKWAVHRIPGFVSNSKQRGDGGVDGWAALLYTPEGENGICIAQVKSGKPDVNALKAMLSQLGGGFASIGVFITLKKWDTPTVKKCIIDAGVLQQGAEAYNRLVVWSIEEHFDGSAPKLPPRAHPHTSKPLQSDILTA